MKGLGPSTYIQDKDFNPDRVEGTCEWFLRHKLFTKWHKSGGSRLLWVSGDPGCGKSVLSKYLVDEKLRKTDDQSTCYYFFKDLSGRNNAATALRAILHQLFDQQPILLKYAVDDLNRTEAGFIHTFETYWDILLKAAGSSEARNIICILDALDECQDSGLQIIGKLNHFYIADSQNSKPSLKFLVTSRPYRNIEQKFVELTRSMPTIRLAGEEARNANAIGHEVNLVIDFNIDNMPWGDETKSQLRAALQAPSNRTYLWVSLVLEVLEKELKLTPKNVTSIVNNLPQTVGHAYEAMLNKSPDKSLARKLLHMVLFAERPMTLAEMNMALNITDDCKTLEEIDRQDTDELLKTQIRTLCGLFLSIVDSQIYLIHQTAKEFLISTPEIVAEGASNCGTLPIWESTFVQHTGHEILARACISYLLLSGIDDLSPPRTQHAFLNYSAEFWALHFREARVIDRESRIAKSALALCDIDSKRYVPLNRQLSLSFYEYDTSILSSKLGFAAFFGHTTTIELLLLSKGIDVNVKSRLGYTPLALASVEGHEEIVKLLVERDDININSGSDGQRTPLTLAGQKGHTGIVKLLLERDEIDVNSRDVHGRTPLYWAFRRRNKDLTKLLRERGAKL
jgi:ankyrin repeat domain-containing protein 50